MKILFEQQDVSEGEVRISIEYDKDMPKFLHGLMVKLKTRLDRTRVSSLLVDVLKTVQSSYHFMPTKSLLKLKKTINEIDRGIDALLRDRNEN